MRHAGARAMGEHEARARLTRQCQQRGHGAVAGLNGKFSHLRTHFIGSHTQTVHD
jgi:hypothetical protein